VTPGRTIRTKSRRRDGIRAKSVLRGELQRPHGTRAPG
jgi:hypothetical protein